MNPIGKRPHVGTPPEQPAKKSRLESYTAALRALTDAFESPAYSESQKLELLERFRLRGYTRVESHLDGIPLPIDQVPSEILQYIFSWLHDELPTLKLVNSAFRDHVESYCSLTFSKFFSELAPELKVRLQTLGIHSFNEWKRSLLLRHKDFMCTSRPLPEMEELDLASFDLKLCLKLEVTMHAIALDIFTRGLRHLSRRSSFNSVSSVVIRPDFTLARPGTVELGNSVLEIPVLPPLGENTSKLIMHADRIHFICPDAFKNLTKIDTLELHELRTNALAPGALSSMENLSTLTLVGMDLTTLDPDRLLECQKLKSLHLQECSISEALASRLTEKGVELIQEERHIPPPAPPLLLIALPRPNFFVEEE